MKLRESGEMYLEAIWILSQKNKTIRAINISNFGKVSKPSVSRAISLLRGGDYVAVDTEGYICLTKSGTEIAEKLYERHQFLVRILTQAGIDQGTAEADACKLEHDICDESFEAIKKRADEAQKRQQIEREITQRGLDK